MYKNIIKKFEGRTCIYDSYTDKYVMHKWNIPQYYNKDYPRIRFSKPRKSKHDKPEFKIRRYINKKRRHSFMGSPFPNLIIHLQNHL